jgi:hypothetical protein
MSPYQQDVINTTLGQYDIQAQKGLPGLAAQAISQVHMVVDEKEFKELNIKINQI